MDKTLPPVNSVFYKGAGSNLIQADSLEAEWLRAKQASKLLALKNVTNQDVSVVGAVKSQARLGDARGILAFGVLRNLAVPVLSATSYIYRFVNDIFPH